MFLLRAILLSVGHHISLLWVRTGSEPDFNTKQLTTSWREWTINIFSRITFPTSEGVCLLSNSLFESTHLQKSADEDHVIWKLVFISTVSKLNDELWSSVSQNLLVIVLGIWWGERVITPTMQLQGCVGFFMVCCDAKKQKKQKKPLQLQLLLLQGSSCQQVVVATRGDFSAHTRPACSAQPGHRCYNTRPVGPKLCRICTSL